jgi:uncharacterized protein (TIGR03435 family)
LRLLTSRAIPLIWVAFGATISQLAAQTGQRAAEPAKMKFEVVSIKPCPNSSGSAGSNVSATPGRLRLECTTLDSLIGSAYLQFATGMPLPIRNGQRTQFITMRQVSQAFKGNVGWIKTERFTIDAKADGPATEEMMRGPMMQDLLKDRFKLGIHREPHEVAVYDLIVAKGGPKFPVWKEGTCTILDASHGPPPPRKPGQPAPAPICGGVRRSQDGGVDLNGVTLATLCFDLSSNLERDVVDKTGLTGLYDIHLELTIEELSPFGGRRGFDTPVDANGLPQASEPVGSIPAAIRKVGLQLLPGKKVIDVIVIDHAARPSGN